SLPEHVRRAPQDLPRVRRQPEEAALPGGRAVQGQRFLHHGLPERRLEVRRQELGRLVRIGGEIRGEIRDEVRRFGGQVGRKLRRQEVGRARRQRRRLS